MKLSVISFTENGKKLSEILTKTIQNEEIEVYLYTKCESNTGNTLDESAMKVNTSVGEWAGIQMQEGAAILFIGACGIAVRAIAPYITDKLQDSPVLVMDEKGGYIIPILSGHFGGANELANYIAKKMGAKPVITTATDINKKFAVDMFAKENDLSIWNKDGIAKVSSKILKGKNITMSIEPQYLSNMADKICLPEEVSILPYPPDGFVDIIISSKDNIFDASVLLKPKKYIIGIGCKRGKSKEEIGSFINCKISEIGISLSQVYALASISQKSDEKGIKEWCREKRIKFLTYNVEELRELDGNFSGSAFVNEIVGVDNVCERAAIKACGENGKLILKKCAENGITVAVAERKWGLGRKYM